ncbi:tRNA(Ser) Um(44) 2'-O-methyltransferase [Mycoemilia scoparia]|uniref:tRNA (uracil-O(2)-)-methyltransferase n=1 Tax=Mycoemilia scoparia TaxID=417184 RepID=A0A9W8A558_9FUNG|nr:tRNA(Ser) Um(44) 2'-O-methyltransferase [Mycoemilia scoparia]
MHYGSHDETLASESVDLETETKRIEAFSLYSPTFSFPADAKEITSPTITVDVAETPIYDIKTKHFQSVLERWAFNAELIIPPVEKTDVVSDSIMPNPEAQPHGVLPFRVIERRLIPKRKNKDPVLHERIQFFELPDDGLRVEFEPLVVSTDKIPFFYPKVKKIVYSIHKNTRARKDDSAYDHDHRHHHEENNHKIVLSLTAHSSDDLCIPKRQLEIFRALFKKLYKWTVNEMIGYRKHSVMDVLVPKDTYTETYHRIKSKYSSKLIEMWVEKTDPQKFVFEDIAIASWLISLWHPKKPSFVDLGCGNGLLVYILRMEGFEGYGIDQCSRKIWDEFSKDCHINLEAKTIHPDSIVLNAEWIIGNHADELVPWIPLLGASSGFKSFVVIPCCPHDLSGKWMQFNTKPGESKYMAYTNYIANLSEKYGYQMEREFLRIPSPKNVALVGRPAAPDNDESKERREKFIQEAKKTIEVEMKRFIPRIPDNVKNEMYIEKVKAKKH